MFGNLGGMMKQVQEAQRKAQKMQEELAAARFEASAGGGLATCVVDGLGNVLDLAIDGAKLGLSAEDAELLTDTVLAAVQEAVRTAHESSAAQLADLTGGLGLPPGLGL
jgi:hypothetical protein